MASFIDQVELVAFTYDVPNLAIAGDGQSMTYQPDGHTTLSRYAVIIKTADGLEGQYVTHWGGLKGSWGQAQMLAPHLLGKDAEQREAIYDCLKREIRQLDHFGHGPLDIALWDLAGKRYGVSISRLLGGYRQKLPAYASTYHGDDQGGLDSPQAYVDFAQTCYDLGYRYFKIHGWNQGDAKREAANVRYVADRLGDRMGLMLDSACELKTFADALYVGRACDEGRYLWFEDPFRDGGTSAFAHHKLRQMIKTPLLLTEHVRGLEPKADFLIAGGTDILRADPEYDMGITGVMKIAHLAESLGVDVELHACGPAHRHCLSAIRNSNYYEVALVGPGCTNALPPVYGPDYSDQLDCIDADGCVDVPAGPGLGVAYDWQYIHRHTTDHAIFN